MTSIRTPIDSTLAGIIQTLLDSKDIIFAKIHKGLYTSNEAKALVDTLIRGCKNKDISISNNEIFQFINRLCIAASLANSTQLQEIFLSALSYYFFKMQHKPDVFILHLIDKPRGTAAKPSMTTISLEQKVSSFINHDGSSHPGMTVQFLFAFATFNLSPSEFLEFQKELLGNNLSKFNITNNCADGALKLTPVKTDHLFPCTYIMDDLNYPPFNLPRYLIMLFDITANIPREIYENIISRRPAGTPDNSALTNQSFTNELSAMCDSLLAEAKDTSNSKPNSGLPSANPKLGG